MQLQATNYVPVYKSHKQKWALNFTLEAKRPVNLHPLFLLWKHESFCDPEKKVQNMGCKKQGAKKQGHYSKREEAA